MSSAFDKKNRRVISSQSAFAGVGITPVCLCQLQNKNENKYALRISKCAEIVRLPPLVSQMYRDRSPLGRFSPASPVEFC